MTGLQMMMGALGIKIPEKDLAALEDLLPRLPQMCVDATNRIKVMHEETTAKLARIESALEVLNGRIDRELQRSIDGPHTYSSGVANSGNGGKSRRR